MIRDSPFFISPENESVFAKMLLPPLAVGAFCWSDIAVNQTRQTHLSCFFPEHSFREYKYRLTHLNATIQRRLHSSSNEPGADKAQGRGDGSLKVRAAEVFESVWKLENSRFMM